MTSELRTAEDYLGLVDKERGLVDRRLFGDETVYEMELERVFARAWNFMAHDTQIANPGDFFMTYIGEDRVIVVRDNEGDPQVLVNSCRHCGNAVCRAEEGHATSFMCTYHGWTYDLKGNLVGVPGFKEVYHEELDRENWGLIKAGKVQSYKGFIFASMDPEAVDLDDYLGPVGRMGIDEIAARDELVFAQGVQKWTIECNWKFAADNAWDYYHGAITHASAGQSRWNGRLGKVMKGPPTGPRSFDVSHRAVLGEYGHALGGPQVTEAMLTDETDIMLDNTWRTRPDAKAALGAVGQRTGGHPGIFPNLWVMQGHNQVSLRLPKGPRKTEIWWFTFTYKNMGEKVAKDMVHRAIGHNGPAGMFEIDDGENWGESTRGMVGAVTQHFPLNYAMNVGNGEVQNAENEPAHIDAGFNEHAQLWYYHSWSQWMAADSWGTLKTSHSSPEGML